MATLRTNQLPVDLTQIGDGPTRAALKVLVDFANEMSQKIATAGTIRGRSLSNNKGNAAIGVDGLLIGDTLNIGLDKTSYFRLKIENGTLTRLGGATPIAAHAVPGQIIGVVGYSSWQNTAKWVPMNTQVVDAVNFWDPNGGALADPTQEPSITMTTVFNADAVNANSYFIGIVYRPTKDQVI